MWVVTKRKKYQSYECGHRQYSEGTGKADCEGTTIREDVILNNLAGHLRDSHSSGMRAWQSGKLPITGS